MNKTVQTNAKKNFFFILYLEEKKLCGHHWIHLIKVSHERKISYHNKVHNVEFTKIRVQNLHNIVF